MLAGFNEFILGFARPDNHFCVESGENAALDAEI